VSLTALALSLALGWTSESAGFAARLPPAPLSLYTVAWHHALVPGSEGAILEEGGVAVDAKTGVAVCGTRDGWLHAYRPDGSRAWELEASGAFPGAPTISDGVVYAGSSDGRVYAVTLADGKLRWSYDAKEEMGTSPAVSGGMVYVMTLQDTLFALDARSGEWKWLHRREGKGFERGFTIRGAAAAVVRDGTVFGGYSDGFVAALDAATGQVKWERQVAPSGQYTDVDGLAMDGGRLYAVAYSGLVAALDAATGTAAWTFRNPLSHRVAVGQGLVVAVSSTQLVGLAPDTGQPVWTAALGSGAPGAAPVFGGRWLLVPAQDAGLRFVEPATGRTMQVFDGGTGVTGAPAVQGERVYVLTNGSFLYALDLR
jgi:outer membrane protein assembly factor BamB